MVLLQLNFMDIDVLVIGAGASGLMAAWQLAKAGKKVKVLEAADRLGGRIHTISATDGTGVIELGAEFIHGNMPVTQQLLQEAGLTFYNVHGSMWREDEGQLKQEDQFIPGWNELAEKMRALEDDMPLADFLHQYFAGDAYEELRTGVMNYAAGYDTANPATASTLALRNEWLQEDEAPQYRINKGYGSLINYLFQQLTAAGVEVLMQCCVKEIHWQPQRVTVTAQTGDSYIARQAVITLPLGVLQADATAQGAVTFMPSVLDKERAFQQIGMGAVIKLLLEFAEPFWLNHEQMNGKDLTDMQFLFSQRSVGTWWTQVPNHRSLLTGWLGGFHAEEFRNATAEELKEAAIASLSDIFRLPEGELNRLLIAFYAVNWTTEPFTLGSYSYATIYTRQAWSVLRQPTAETLFWAGEALYDGPFTGTVEAALVSGMQVAEQLLAG
ncbi:monoamine oxidase [Filimonas zeae]|uniref:Tryptophan 2-monooxygenase n=1 Tax=Filimonas zeae TaxID=1737353 RepID=A0A917J393_9BACT|nr:NAD(P)/FAD-dependent oxidoreductase [Filimonas zeae]MDR6342419.1 monoamine oxidase [Filimonas zeae]GGH81243.1 hypothetical protein GCM10011379_53340 [Filimonas zeae]